MKLSLTFEDCTPDQAAALMRAAGFSAPGAGAPAPGAGAPPPYSPAHASAAPPAMNPAAPPAPIAPAAPVVSAPPAAPAPPPPAPSAAPVAAVDGPMVAAMQAYALTYKADGVKAVLRYCNRGTDMRAQDGTPEQKAWLLQYFQSMAAPPA